MNDTGILLQRLEAWVHHEIPRLNNAIEGGFLSLDELISLFQEWIGEVNEAFEPSIDQLIREKTRMILQLLGFGISSIENHSQEKHYPGGIGLSPLQSVENILATLNQVSFEYRCRNL